MKTGIVSRRDAHKWGGDLRALHTLRDGLVECGHDARIAPTPYDLLDCDFVFLSNTCEDQRENAAAVKAASIPFGLVGFHEDFLTYYTTCVGFADYVNRCVQDMEDNQLPCTLDQLRANPNVAHYYGELTPRNALYNTPVMAEARICLAASHSEARTMRRDCPSCNAQVVFWSVELGLHLVESGDEFLKLTGLTAGEYILQVGRLETRKNQVGAVLATMDMDAPLVFIATRGYQDFYDLLLVNVAAKYRRGPTFIISEQYPAQVIGNKVHIIQMPDGKRLSDACLVSAYRNCGLHFHPAFWEAPGYTYLEAARLGVPTVASEWGTIQDYCTFGDGDLHMGGLMAFAPPYDIAAMEQAVREQFGKPHNPEYEHPIFRRRKADVGRETWQLLEAYGPR